MSFRAVLFDLDGTLHDRAATVRRYLAGHVERFGLPDGYAERWAVLDDLGYTPKHRLCAQLVEEFGLAHHPDALLQDWLTHGKLTPSLVVQTHETLAELRSRGVRLGLLTNGRGEGQRATQTGLNLQDAFDIVLISEEVGAGKPDPRIYSLATKHLGVQAHETLFVGDSPVNDVQGPQSVGIKAALFPGGHPLPAHIRSEFVLGDLRGVLEIVQPAQPRA